MSELLPIGTVVLLKEAKKRVMIVGYFPTVEHDGNELTFDYSCCLFPEGFIGDGETLAFNHNQISKIYFQGLIDNEQINFINDLCKVVQEEFNNRV